MILVSGSLDSLEVCKLCWETHYKQADNTGRAGVSAFHTVTPPSFSNDTISVHSFISDLQTPHRTLSVAASSLLLGFFQQHPSHPNKRLRKTPLQLKLVHWLGQQELFLVPGFLQKCRGLMVQTGSNLYPRQQDWVSWKVTSSCNITASFTSKV